MRLHDDRVAGGEAGEEAGVAVPGREGLAADDQRHAARHHPPVLLQHDRRGLALRLLPDRGGGRARHLGPGHRHRLETPILRMRAAGLERHRKGLAGGVHHGIRHLEAHGVQPGQRLEEEADAGLRGGRGPGGAGGFRRRDEGLGVSRGIGDAERRPPRRRLGADPMRFGMPFEGEGGPELRSVGGKPVLARGFAIDLAARNLRERRPETAVAERRDRAVEKRAMPVEQRAHCVPSPDVRWFYN